MYDTLGYGMVQDNLGTESPSSSYWQGEALVQNFLRSVPLFSDLSEEDLARVLRIAAEVRLSQGVYLFEEGNRGRYFFLIKEGEIEIFTTSGDMKLSLAVRGPGEFIGELAMLDMSPRMASARARTESVLMVIPREEFHHLLEASPSAARNLLYTILPRLRHTEVVLRERERQIREQTCQLEKTLDELQKAQLDLEQRVAERTAELLNQVKRREQAEHELRVYREHLEELVRYRTEELEKSNQTIQTMQHRLQSELLMAQRVQRSLLPPTQPGIANLDIMCYSSPSREVGGDFYTYHAFENGSAALAVGDASGQGMPAVFLAAISLAAFQTAITTTSAPDQLLLALREATAIYTSVTRQHCKVCCTYIDGNTAQVANAGCIAPLLFQANGRMQWVDVNGIPLGVGRNVETEYTSVSIALEQGDMLVLTSDGVVSTRSEDGEIFGLHRLEETVAMGPRTSAMAMLTHIRSRLAYFAGSQDPNDDVTIVVVRR
jgi:serine phosphatase RsbU (regulator of sigma subunit)